MEVASDMAVGFVGRAVEWLVGRIGRHICFVVKYRSNVKSLKDTNDDIENATERMDHSVEYAERQGYVIHKEVEKWRNSGKEYIGVVQKLIVEDEDEAKKRCCRGLCLNLKTRYSISKEAAKLVKDGAKLLAKRTPDPVYHRPCPCLPRTPSIFLKDYEEFDSRTSLVNEIMEALMDTDMKMIGVFGMGGVGKTTLVKKIASLAMEDNTVVFAEAKNPSNFQGEWNPDLKDIQLQIANDLGLEFGSEDLRGRATRLHQKLKKENRLLVIIDNIWGKLDLESLGIPLHENEGLQGRNDDQRQFKILLTSRGADVLTKYMKTQKNFLLKPLSQEEAMDLFGNIVGDSANESEFQSLAVEIVGKCAGLPVAITAIANALKDESCSVWSDALNQLKRYNINDIDTSLYSVIKLSYNFLKNEDAKLVFQLCALYGAGHHISIDYLVRYGMGLGWFQNVYTLKEGRDKVDRLIKILKASSLLLDGYVSTYVKMHDIIHSIAVSIASREKLMFNLQNVHDLKEMLEDKIPEDPTGISLPYGDIYELPEKMECKKLKLLMLFMKDSTEGDLHIPDTFFEEMKELRVLDLTGIHSPLLPSSISLLKSLRTLCLDNCVLGDVGLIGELTKLKILSFLDSDIEQLPEQIGKLTQLKLLDLSNCSKLKVIVAGVLSKLTNLEELYIGSSFVRWEVEGLNNQARKNASLDELKQLKKLTTLEIHVTEVRAIPEDFFSAIGSLIRYRIFIGEEWKWSGTYETSKTLKLKLNDSVYKYGIEKLLKTTQDLYLDDVNDVKNVLSELDPEGFADLKHLHLQNNPQILYIMDSTGRSSETALPSLASLFLQILMNLEKICNGQLGVNSFQKLRTIEVGKCDKLKHLFSFSMVKNLLQLQEMKVTYCKKLKMFFSVEREDQVHNVERTCKAEFAEMHSLTLQGLPQLASFGFGTNSGSNEIISQDEPDDFMTLFSRKVVFPRLENLKLSTMNIKNLWVYQSPATCSWGQTLSRLTVEECDGLKFVFSSSMIKSLLQLQNLEIRNCKSMEMVINSEELGGELTFTEMLFPKLFYLELKGLPKLTRFGTGSPLKLPSLKEILIDSCPSLNTFFSNSSCANVTTSKDPALISSDTPHVDKLPLFDEMVAVPNLEKMFLLNLHKLEMIWHNQLQADSFRKLQVLNVTHCENLITVFPSSALERISRLQYLIIIGCCSLVEVFNFEGINFEETTSSSVAFQLKALSVHHLPKLRHVWSKDPQQILTFRNLQKLSVIGCSSMTSLFPISIAKDLKHLESLELISSGLKEIVSNDGLELAPKFVFPKLNHLQLWSLPNLRSFYPGLHTTEWPVIESLLVLHCHDMNIMSSEFLSVRESEENHSETSIERPLFLIEKVIPNLEKLSFSINEMILMRRINLPAKAFCKIKMLEVVCFHDKHCADFPFDILQSFTSLEKLVVRFSEFQELFKGPEEEKFAKIQTQIKNLMLDSLPDLKLIWNPESKLNLHSLETIEVAYCDSLTCLAPSLASFQNLRSIEVWNCKGLVNLVACSTARSLAQLVKLRVTECPLLKEIIIVDDVYGEVEEIEFKRLEVLELECLPSLACFCSSNHAFKFPSLERVIVKQCPNLKIFSPGVLSVPRLEGVQITEEKDHQYWKGNLNSTIQQLSIEMVGFRDLITLVLSDFSQWNDIREGHVPVYYLSKLRSLIVDNCEHASCAIPGILLGSLNNLQLLDVRNCDSVEQLFDLEKPNSSGLNGLLRQLSQVCLFDLPILRHIWKSSLLKSFSFESLTLLEIHNCSSLRYVLIPAIVPSLLHLQVMKIQKCSMLEEIITNEGEESMADNKIMFPFLNNIILESLPMLTSFYSGRIFLECPSLKFITIDDCRKMEPLFSEKVILHAIEELKLSLVSTKNVWLNQVASLPQNLTCLAMYGCDDIKNLFSSSMVEGLVQLNILRICNCKIMEAVIVSEEESITESLFPSLKELMLKDLPTLTRFCCSRNLIQLSSLSILLIENCPNMGAFISNSFFIDTRASNRIEEMITDEKLLANTQPFFDDKVGLPSLEFLHICYMDNLRKIWHERLTLDSFSKLRDLKVGYCDNLSNIFSSTMSGRIQRLVEMAIFKCDSLDYVFEVVETGQSMMEDSVPRVVFPQLTSLYLRVLPRLKSFHPGRHISEWPTLKKLEVYGCDGVEIFASEIHEESAHDDSVQKTLFWVDRDAFPNLEELKLEYNEIMKELWCGKISEKLRKLTVLELICFPEESAMSPSYFLQMLPNLEKFLVSDASFKEIFLHTKALGSEENHGQVLFRLSNLKLSNLPELLHLWRENSQPFEVFQNLKTLEVSDCGKLKILVLSSISFQNLTTLEVSTCGGLVHLLTRSTAKSLVQLTRMNIINCEMIEGIITHAGDEEEDNIVFGELKYLSLCCLPNLISFCSGKCSFGFPSLEELIVTQCPKMMIFSEEALVAPKLQRLLLSDKEDGSCWEGDINTTIQHMYQEMVGFHGLDYLKLSQFPHLQQIWHGQIPTSFFFTLRSLVVDECERMSSAISANLLRVLHRLEILDIRNCDSLEEVFDIKELANNEDFALLPELSEIYLTDLPRLRQISKNTWQGLLFFENLKLIEVHNCRSLSYIFTPSIVLGLAQLKEIQLENCASMEEIIGREREKDEAVDKIIFHSLNSIVLKSLPSLTSFYSGFCKLEYPSLKTIIIINCPKMKPFDFPDEDPDNCITPLSNGKVDSPAQVTRLNLSSVGVEQVAFASLEV